MIYPNGKINLGLQIVEKRTDGYHNIQTVFYPVGLNDKLEVTRDFRSNDITLNAHGIRIKGKPEDNLIVSTYYAIKEKFGSKVGGVNVDFTKIIPYGAGLGGGSSDATYMAIELNRIFHLGMKVAELCEFVGQIGADCPFFVHNKPMYATGIGNVLEPAHVNLEGWYVLLVVPNTKVSTADAYKLVEPHIPERQLKDILSTEPVDNWKNWLKNDFEESVFEQFPDIAEIKQKLYDIGAVYASMTGSGSTCYGLFRTNPVIGDTFGHLFTYQQVLR